MGKYRIWDVSQWIDDFCFLGDQAFSLKGPFNRVPGNNPEYVYDLILCSQSGTHIQGGHYFNKDGKKIHEYQLSDFEGEAWIFDIEKKGTDTTASDLRDLFGSVNLSRKIVIFRTGNMDDIIQQRKVEDDKRPGFSMDAAVFLTEELNIKMIAIDAIGVESRKTSNFEVNTYLSSKSMLILEGLVGLKQIKSQRVFLEAFPLKIKGIEGTPCRAIIKEPI